MMKCHACGVTMTPADNSEWNNSDDRQCVYKPTRCQECCRCGGHS